MSRAAPPDAPGSPGLASGRRLPRATAVLLIAVLALAAALRFVGLGHGLPHVVGVDEGFEIHRALELGAGRFDFERVAKGGFFYLLFVEYGLYYGLLRLAGAVTSPDDFAVRFAVDPTPFWLIARVTHALVAVLAVLWTFVLGRRFYGPAAGLAAAAVVAVSTVHVAKSHYVGVDLPMTFLVLVALGLAQRWSDPGERCRPLLLGAVVGLAAMTKIVAVAVLVPVALANWLRHRRSSLPRALAGGDVLLVYLVAALVFVAGNPGVVTGFEEFARGVWETLFGAGRRVEGFADAARGENLWLFYLRVLLGDLGPGVLPLAAGGALLGLARRRPADLLLIAGAAAFYVLIAGAKTSHLYYPRYVIPLVPLLALLAASFLDHLARRLRPGLMRVPLVLAATALLLLPTAIRSLSWVARQTRDDTRVVARRWLETHAAPGATVFLIGNPMVSTAPNLSLPLRDADANRRRLIAALRPAEPAKARVLELRRRAAGGVPFDLRTARHFEPLAALAVYERQGVEYFALTGDRFAPKRLAGDRKHASAVLASRAALREALLSHPRAELVFAVDPEAAGLSGPAVEIFRLRPPPGGAGS